MIDIKAMRKWLLDAANYFDRRPTGGEDLAHWSNVQNAENCRKISRLLVDADCRYWFHYPIVIPVNETGAGPEDIGKAVKLTWEVWDQELRSHASFDTLPEAINEAMRLNRGLM